MDELKKLMEKEARGGTYHPFFKFSKERSEFLGQLLASRKDPRGDGTLWDVHNLEDGQKYTLPSYTVLESLLNEWGAKVGDYVYIKFLGEGKRGKGRPAYLFKVTVMPKEKAEALLKKKPKPEKPREPPKKEEPTPSPEEPPRDRSLVDKGKNIILTLLDIYSELEVKRAEEALKKQGVDVPIEEVCREAGVKIEGDKVVKA